MTDSSNQPDNPTEKEDYHFAWYIAAWIDLLGQSEKLAQFDELPTNENQKHEFLERVRQTFGIVGRFRSQLQNLHHLMFSKPLSLPSEMIAAVSEADRQLFDRYKSPNVDIRFLSDSALFTVCLNERQSFFPLGSIDDLFSELAFLTLALLAQGIPIRGGVGLGICSKLPAGDLYGVAVARAYKLESMAGISQILIDDVVFEYLRWCQAQAAEGKERELKVHHIESIKRACRRDGERFILSYLDRVRSIDRERDGEFQQAVIFASTFIAREIERLQNLKLKDEKLLPRYRTLKAYFEIEGCWNPSSSSIFDN